MRVIPEIPDDAKNGALSIGNFDGVHSGHQGLIRDLKALANRVSGPSVVITFDPPPLRLLKPDLAPATLTPPETKKELLLKLGVDHVIIVPTTLDLLRLSAQEFFELIVLNQLQARAILEGNNFRFGRGREGDVNLLKNLCETHKIMFQLATPKESDGRWISSTRVRDWISNGELATANEALGRHYQISGVVGQGAQRGRTLGFPTANLFDIQELIPAHGVYAAKVTQALRNGQSLQNALDKAVALHIGPNPTFGEGHSKVEAHLLDFSGDLYGASLTLEILQEVRPVQKFDSKDALLEQLNKDIAFVRSCFSSDPTPIS